MAKDTNRVMIEFHVGKNRYFTQYVEGDEMYRTGFYLWHRETTPMGNPCNRMIDVFKTLDDIYKWIEKKH